MGTGKTTVGRRIAARLDRDFVDADEALAQIAGRSIAEIFATDGEAAFRAVEADVLEELLEHPRPSVIASGGGVVLRSESRTRLQAPGVTVVWLSASPAFLASRIQGKPHRPLLGDGDSALGVLTAQLEQRAPLYESVADVTIDVEPFHRDEEKPKKALAARIAELVVEHEASSVAGGTRP